MKINRFQDLELISLQSQTIFTAMTTTHLISTSIQMTIQEFNKFIAYVISGSYIYTSFSK